MDMIERKTWNEFRNAGFIWFINMILHVFGWALVVEYADRNDLTAEPIVYPARVKFRGFEPESNDRGYLKITKYMAEHSDELLHEITNEDENDITGGNK